MASSGMLRRVALVRTDVAEELSASFIRMTIIGELRTTLDVKWCLLGCYAVWLL
jgi:DNA-binding TFAR19-related protein (PDSD5 family)